MRNLLLAQVVLLSLVALPHQAWARGVAPTVACSVSDVGTVAGGADAKQCRTRTGNDNGNKLTGVTTYINQQWGSAYGAFVSKGFSDASGGPFVGHVNATTGSLVFNSTVFGYFVISLKGGNDHNLYLMYAGENGATGVNFNTIGLLNGGGNTPNLSHAGLWQGGLNCVGDDCGPPNPGVVPEPSSLALMFGGLMGLTVAARRRRKV